MGKHDSGNTSGSAKSGSGGKHGDDSKQTEWDREGSFQVRSQERIDRGVGDQQTGGRDD